MCTNCGVCVPGSTRCEAQFSREGYSGGSECTVVRHRIRLADVPARWRFIGRRGLNVTSADRPKYNPLYYFNERIGQFMLTCPPPPEDALEGIEAEYYYNADQYPGDPQQLTRATAVKMCKAAVFVTAKGDEATCGRYAERWKYILMHLGKEFWLPPPEFVLFVESLNPAMEKEIRQQLRTMKKTKQRLRHNNNTKKPPRRRKDPNGPSMDYRIRLMLWLWNDQKETIWDSEFPYLKTAEKRRNCDLIFANVCKALKLPFAPSTERNNPPSMQ